MSATDEDPAPAVLSNLRARGDDMEALLAELVVLESPSSDPASQDGVRERLSEELQAVGFATRRVRSTVVGDHLLALPPERRRDRPVQLVLGHVDTVWPVGTIRERRAAAGAERLAGPGALDMKGGLVQLVFALAAIRDLGLDVPAEIAIFLNTDEEIGSPDSRRWIEPLGRLAVRAYVLEGAVGVRGDLKVGRKGVGRFELRAKGLAAHAGLDPASGASAVLEISLQIQRLFEMNDPDRGITVNVGTVDGGLRPNVVAPEASAEIDVRVYTAADAQEVEEAIRALEPVDPNVVLEIEGGFTRPPMERTAGNEGLWRQAATLGEKLGIELGAAVVGGASDGNLTSPHTATLDGLGAVGDGAHRVDEFVRLDAMAERAALLALLLMSPVAPPAGQGG